MLDPDGFVTGYYSSLGRYHNHSLENPNFRAHTEGGFTRLIAIRNCDKGDEVLVDYNDYRYIPNVEIPGNFEEEPKQEAAKKEDAPPKEAAKATKPRVTKKPRKTKIAAKAVAMKNLEALKRKKKAKSV